MVIVSINQRITESFLEKMIVDTKWRRLSTNDKREVFDYIKNQSTLSSMNKTTIDSFYSKSFDKFQFKESSKSSNKSVSFDRDKDKVSNTGCPVVITMLTDSNR